MKKSFLHILALGLVFVSCSNDDDNSATDFKGITYKLIEVNVETPQDVNGDGKANRNEMLETDCYQNTQIVLESPTDFYNVTQKFGHLDRGLEVSTSCQSNDYNGTYELSEKQLVLKDKDQKEETFQIVGDQLKVSYDWTFFDGDLTKKVEFVYQKQ
ncbi:MULTISPECIES: lipocalin family protein [Aquimarina]|uniref:Lipocalin-like domain-containing protein n=1 Tax=Aquimarina algiphila TaxID=2047982 RepID=A0A554VEL6_9FLAO|nr:MULTISPECIES: lipocalin family protein [Aquimarina]TSE05486.1 hypothetical protein FOF46_22720 [Aquimarina algiphila]